MGIVFFWDCDNKVVNETESRYKQDDELYEAANYYSSETLAKNNARADKLMRQLRRFAVEHRENELDWNNTYQPKYYIHYDTSLVIGYIFYTRDFGCIYFDTRETTQAAIETFNDELIWYFTEYKDSL